MLNLGKSTIKSDIQVVISLFLLQGQRVFITGRTGSGKTFCVKKVILPLLDRFVFHDFKWEHNFKQCKLCHTPADFLELMTAGEKFIHYQPYDGSTEDFDLFCEILFKFCHTTLIIDEIARYTIPQNISKHFDLCLRLGRSRGLSVITCSQRPSGIHNNILSESDIFIVFQLLLTSDREKLRGIIGDVVDKIDGLQKFGFLYRDVNADLTKIYPPIKL